MVKASLSTKLSTLSADPMIHGALKVVTDYAGTSLKERSMLSLAYLWNEVTEQHEYTTFVVRHNTTPTQAGL